LKPNRPASYERSIYTVNRMVRPEQSCIHLAGESPVQASIGALGSRPQPRDESLRAEWGVKGPSSQRGATKRAATIVNATASSKYQPKGDREGRAAHVTAKAIDSAGNPGNAKGHTPALALSGV
jgi:hypothetical protein